MSTPSMIWVLVRSTDARDNFLKYIDSGNFKEAIDLKASLEGMVNQLKSFIQQYGAGCPIACDDVVAMKIPVTLARNLENILSIYLKNMPGMAVGVGFNFFEAASACKRSKKTRKIELYQQRNGESLERKEDPEIHKLLNQSVVLPGNLYDPKIASDEQYLDQLKEPSVVDMPGFQAEIQAESAYIKVIASQMGSPSDAQIQQAQQAQQAAQQAAQGPEGQVDQSQNPNAKSMLSALGKNPPKPNDKDEDGEDKEESGKSLKDAKGKDKSSKEDGKKDDSGKKSSKEGDSDDKSSKEDDSEDEDLEGMDKAKIEAEIKEAESAAKADHNQKLFDQLDRIKADLPQIMGLAQKDPKAFKQSMQMVGKLLDVAKQVQKGELDLVDEDVLEKTRLELNLPVGSRKGTKKKVQVSGKPAVWRSMKTGQTKDDDGTPISVRQHNIKMKQKTNQ